MELIKGNMLFILTFLGTFIFALLWGKVYEGPIRWRFSFYRRKNMYYEWKRLGGLLMVVSFGCAGIYKIVCYCLQFQGVPMYYLLFPFVLLLFYYFVLSIGVRSFRIFTVMSIISIMFLFPAVVGVGMIVMQKCFDVYCGRLVILFAVLDVFMGIKNISHWKKGDVMK